MQALQDKIVELLNKQIDHLRARVNKVESKNDELERRARAVEKALENRWTPEAVLRLLRGDE